MPENNTYNADARVQTLAAALGQDTGLVAKVWNKQLRTGAQSVDDFAFFEGGEKDSKPFVVKKDLENYNAGDSVVFTVMSQPRGPGVRGEQELTGNTSSVNWATYTCKVDFWRDAFEWNKKQAKFMAAGGSVKSAIMDQLKMKLGRKRMNDMKMALKLLGKGNTIYPNGKRGFDQLTAGDTMSPTVLTMAKPQWQRLGGMPFKIGHNKHRSPVYSCMAYIPDVAMTSLRMHHSYENALMNAAARSDDHPLYSGRLLDWQGIGLFEHISVDAEYDVLADPLAPRAILGVGFGVDSAAGSCKLISDAGDTQTRFFEWFGGYKYEWWEGQAAHADWNDFYNHADTGICGANRKYYAWIVNTDGSVGFVEYLGTGNNGNQITISKILSPDGAGTSTKGAAVVGKINATGNTWDSTPGPGMVDEEEEDGSNTSPDFNYTDTFLAGAYVIPCNERGAVDMCSLMLGKNSAVRAYVGDDKMIYQERDYGFTHGGGYESIFGQTPCIRTDRKTTGYALIRHAGQHPGLEVPTLEE
ncbi:hypothetical protein EI77_04706 [Prosthecobacter fusiformis]|uniref:Uncharacterized protein n=1 Tax=Prosthecobacter fusiformis TaxID=48464 RepID=A0A4R7RHZ3_9BACT|nr:hypothetical protein [Prosthecobacter fusiformis]TDU62482.1 hypothetical protein EI77_04706 [Prosthecobacter fusiformis]